MSGWQIDDIEETPRGLLVKFVRHSDYVGEPSQRCGGFFWRWQTLTDSSLNQNSVMILQDQGCLEQQSHKERTKW